MKIEIKSLENKKVGDVTLPSSIFGEAVRSDIIARVIHWQLAKRRSGNHQVKRIGDVQGTSKKPFRQKGTGNARQGSLRSPQMRGGATMHGPVTRDHGYQLPKKIRALGLRSALASKAVDNKIVVLDSFDAKQVKTSDMKKKLDKLGLSKALFIDGDTVDMGFLNSISNLVGINAIPSQGANVYDIMRHETLVLSQSALEKLEARLS